MENVVFLSTDGAIIGDVLAGDGAVNFLGTAVAVKSARPST